YGTAANFIRPFICTFLQADGTPYTDRDGWETETFFEECQNRDARLAQIIRTPGYTREGKKALPEYKAYARLGYQPIKLCVDETYGDEKSLNTNALSLFRYGEILLNYAEAKAELGTLSDADWAATIGALRARAGITGGLTAKPTKVDQWFQSTYYPGVTDPSILEVRRERAIELCLEGFRFDDLRRWNAGNLLTMSYTGIYVPVIDEPLDMDNDGVPDVIFYTSDESRKAAQAMPGGKDCQVRLVSADPTSPNVQIHPAPGGGYYLAWDTQEDNVRVFGNKQYLYPIPAIVMVKNPNITQNPGWENNASNDGN
ncbi:MAG: RagB/SusD family nutrient uptake outer membrane protein, partial [Bacteroidales bacterium]|nr:RagB/SusD family nutrient uptake outer membrane protein [Bacteroidales bacterium]